MCILRLTPNYEKDITNSVKESRKNWSILLQDKKLLFLFNSEFLKMMLNTRLRSFLYVPSV
jgi:hypothetical protein